ncbi:arylsulfatase [Arenibacter sp. F20364]|uniref:arylsulfatase n=1 Tax=Arenibacter sp. F20364 TaxID=2926415 RepID=UPI001FF40D88|nr:arylsulfatase [Arenibacter sp. F20364]MCK0189970.1 arylsulfatase [Arenibacter sp. F20364]
MVTDMNRNNSKKYFICVLALFVQFGFSQQSKPNVILVLTDDQGIGDLGCHGNPWLKTPNIDAFYKDAVRMTDFHVSPVCTPTRGAIMTGRYPINNGAWATYKGRDALSEGATTMARLFQKNGYRTGMFGKWHLGDNYPVRPIDLGFEVAVHHKSGGVGELSDYWGNTYFNDTYFVNEEPKRFEGYCTDVWFDEAMKFIEDTEEPFFIYLPTNAPHSPHYVDEKYAEPYKSLVGTEIPNAEFFGMIANIDENFGRLEKFLKKRKLADNTILIFMTDNGATAGFDSKRNLGYNMGFRGRKGDELEGGHRVPFFIRWKEGKVTGGWDINATTAHVDLIPTLAGLCDIEISEKLKLDGLDFSPLLLKKDNELGERTLFVHSRQDWRPPHDIAQTCLILDKWRLVNGTALYDIENDRRQENDIAAQNPELVQRLLSNNSNFLNEVKTNTEYYEVPTAIVGNPNQKEIKLTIQHAIGDDSPIWKSEQVAEGLKNQNNRHAINVEQEGTYRISCRRWPKECSGPILGVPKQNPKNWFEYKPISPNKARIQIANQIVEKDIKLEEEEVTFEVYLEKGKTFLVNDFIEGDEKYGVYYTYVTFLESGKNND